MLPRHHPKNRAVRVVAHQQRAIMGDRQSSRPAPDTLAIENEPVRQEVFVLANRLASKRTRITL
jgi:hypothetical protein